MTYEEYIKQYSYVVPSTEILKDTNRNNDNMGNIITSKEYIDTKYKVPFRIKEK